jgi:glycerophosphoryl diester phosphodiesterase
MKIRAITVCVAVTLVALSTACTSDDDEGRVVDLQGHRGARGLIVEESLAAYTKALGLGVSTLELDIVLSKDKVPLVWHDPTVLDTKCTDTSPATPDDPQFPYVGKLVHDLTNNQLQTLDCGSKTLKDYPEQQAVPGNKIATLPQLFDLVKSHNADIRYNIETKIEAEKPEESATPQEFVDVILATVDAAGVKDQVDIQSFDWRSLTLVHRTEPSIPLVALYDETTFVPGSKWLGDIAFDEFSNDPIGAVAKLGANVVSPNYKLITDKAYTDKAHEAGLTVIPWTVNDKSAIAAQIDLGVDGVITDYPNRAREVLQEKGLPLPKAYPI